MVPSPHVPRNLAHLVELLDAGTEGLIITTTGGSILVCTTAAQRLLRCSAAQTIGRPVGQFISQEFLENASGCGSPSMDEQPARVTRIDIVGADGGRSAAEMAITRIELDGQTVYAIALRDVALRKWAHDELLSSARADSAARRSDETLRLLNASLEWQAGRIAQALHDEAGQLLTSAYIALTEIGEDLSPAAAMRLEHVRAHLDAIEAQLRRLAHEIRPRVLDDLGLVAALEFLAEGVEQRWRIAVIVNASLQRRLPSHIETTVYRLVQEALNNASKHAHANRVAVDLEDSTRTLRCVIEDDGVGFDPASYAAMAGENGFGLAGIRDQLDMLGGTFQIGSAPGRGTRLTIAIPLEQ